MGPSLEQIFPGCWQLARQRASLPAECALTCADRASNRRSCERKDGARTNLTGAFGLPRVAGFCASTNDVRGAPWRGDLRSGSSESAGNCAGAMWARRILRTDAAPESVRVFAPDDSAISAVQRLQARAILRFLAENQCHKALNPRRMLVKFVPRSLLCPYTEWAAY